MNDPDAELVSIAHNFAVEQIEAAAFLLASGSPPEQVIKCLAAAAKMLRASAKLIDNRPQPKHE